MDQPFFIFSGYPWVSVLILPSAILAALVFYRAGLALRESNKTTHRALWLVGGGALAGLILWGAHFEQFFFLSVNGVNSSGLMFLLGALAFAVVAAGYTLWLLGQQNLSKRKLLSGGLVLSGCLILGSALQWNSLQVRLLLPHEFHQTLWSGLCALVSVLAISTALWLPTQPKSSSHKVQALQDWVSPFAMSLALMSALLTGLTASSFLPPLRPVVHGLLYPALGQSVISRLLLLEALAFGCILALISFYALRRRREKEAQACSILSSNAIGMILCDYDGNFLCVNDAFLEIVGYQRPELEAKVLSWSQLTPPEFEALDRKAIGELKNKSMVADYEKQLIRQDGQRVDVLIAGLNQVADYDNTAMGYVLDITEKKKALFGIHESEARFRQLADSNLIGVVFWNIYGSIYDANEVFLSMLGYSREELQAGEINWRNVILPQDEVTQAAMVQQAIAGKKVEPYETVFLHHNGSRVDVQVGFAMLHGAREKGFSFVQDISERKRAEAALLENYQRINLILEAIPHKVWTAEANGQSSYSNQNLLKYAGLTQEELNRAGWGVYLHPDDAEATIASWQAAVQTGQLFEAICRFKRYDGYYRWHLSTASPVYSSSGELIVWVGTNTDIHEMKLAQDRLTESEERFRYMAEQSPIMIWVTNDVGEVTYVNSKLSDFMDFTPERPLTAQWLQGMNPEDEARVAQAWQAALQYQSVFEATFRHRHREGDERWVSASGNPIQSTDGDFWGFVGTFVDITDQKRLQEKLEAEVLSRTTELQENMTLFYSLIENVPSIIFLKDAKGLRFKLFNKVGRELFGFTEENYLDKTDHDFFPAEQADFFIATDRETLTGQELVDIPEERVLTSDGETHILHTKKVPIFDKQGNPAYLLGVSEDITALKQTQDQILNLNLQLQEQVQTVSAAHKALESFSYSVSHDLRAPLRTIDGYSQVVLENYGEQLDDTGKHYLSRVREGSQQMAKLIDDMLNLSRLSRSELKKENVCLSDLVRNIARDLQESEPGREVEFIIQDGLFVQADKRLIQSVLQNLLDNAWKFTSHHPRAIIEFGRLHEHGKPVFFVRDDGAGFDMAYVDKLFGTFQRLHSAADFAGTGIGLASAQRIINRHGGEIWAQGELEHGAVFYFSL